MILDAIVQKSSPRALLALTMMLAAIWSPAIRANLDTNVTIVVNPSVQIGELDRDDLARIYLGKKTLWESGTRIRPSMLSEKSPSTQEFLESNLRKTIRQYRNYWKRRLFSGGGTAPKTFNSSSQVIDFVASNEGGIGVVEGGVSDDRVVVVDIK